MEPSFFLFFFILRFFTVRRFLTIYGSRFALTASGGSCRGLILFLHLVGGSRVLNGITSGWDQVRMGPDGIRRAKKGPVSFSRFNGENIPRKLFFYHIEDSTDNVTLRHVANDKDVGNSTPVSRPIKSMSASEIELVSLALPRGTLRPQVSHYRMTQGA